LAAYYWPAFGKPLLRYLNTLRPFQDVDGCVACESGKYSDEEGMAVCDGCPPGRKVCVTRRGAPRAHTLAAAAPSTIMQPL
jgi:hypothetical protein